LGKALRTSSSSLMGLQTQSLLSPNMTYGWPSGF
jgi:hypothetical protein